MLGVCCGWVSGVCWELVEPPGAADGGQYINRPSTWFCRLCLGSPARKDQGTIAGAQPIHIAALNGLLEMVQYLDLEGGLAAGDRVVAFGGGAT